MARKPGVASRFYARLINLYPRAFKARLGESMQQTFDDLYRTHARNKGRAAWRFVAWLFLDTAAGVLRERVRSVATGGVLYMTLKTLAASALLAATLLLPLVVMEVVNQPNDAADFPAMLFFVLWLNLFAITVILLPIVQGMRQARRDGAQRVLAQQALSAAEARPAALRSVLLVLVPVALAALDAAGWVPLGRWLNGPNPDVAYLPGQIVSLGLLFFPVAAGVVARTPIVRMLQAGGRLLSHPLHLFIVAALCALFAAGTAGIVVDQWPCFMGVPNCD